MEETDSGEDDPGDLLVQLLIIVVLTALNAFFASSELAVISANKTKIRLLAEQGNKKAKALEKLAKDETRFLSTIQVGVTLAGFFSSAAAAQSMGGIVGGWIEALGVEAGVAETIAVVAVTIVLSYFNLVFGELYPKRVALRHPEKTAMNVARSILIIRTVLFPFVKLLSASTELISKITGLGNAEEEKITQEEIKSVIQDGVEDGTLNQEEQRMIESIFKFDALTAMDIMTPRVNVCMVDIDDSVQNIAEILNREQYSRVPVYKEDRDNIVGILLYRDFMTALYTGGSEKLDLKDFVRDAYFVADHIKIDDLFAQMKKKHVHMAVLTDEFGGFTGIVTMEDLIEEIVGNIYDEYDVDETEHIISEKGKENVYIVNGLTPIQEVNRETGTEFDEDNEDYDTIGGLVVSLLGHLPSRNEKGIFNVDNTELEILQVDHRRISKIRLTINPVEKEEEEE